MTRTTVRITLWASCVVAAVSLVAVAAQRIIAGSRRTKCMENSRQMGLALAMYTADYDDHLPLAASWSDGLVPYTANRNRFRCPAGLDRGVSYGYNEPIGRAASEAIQYPAKTVALFEADCDWNGVAGKSRFAKRHQGGAHVVFVDCHTKWMRNPVSRLLIWEPFRKPIPPVASWPEPAVFRHEPNEANRWFARVQRGDRSVISEMRRALNSLLPLRHGGVRWAPPLVNALSTCGQRDLEAAAESWGARHHLSRLNLPQPKERDTAIGFEYLSPAHPSLAVVFECGPWRFEFASLRIPAEAQDHEWDSEWHGTLFYRFSPTGTELTREVGSGQMVTTKYSEDQVAIEKSWSGGGATYEGRRLLFRRPGASRPWVWRGSLR